MPWVANRFLARTGAESQFAVPYDDRPDDLFDPVSGAPGAHGEFDDESRGGGPPTRTHRTPAGGRSGRVDARRRRRERVTRRRVTPEDGRPSPRRGALVVSNAFTR